MTILKRSQPHLDYAIVDLGDARHMSLAAVPSHGTTAAQQVRDVLERIEAATRQELGEGSLLSQTVFAADVGLLSELSGIVQDFYGHHLPATTYVLQPPGQGTLLAVEATALGPGRGDVWVERCHPHTVIAHHSGAAWVHCSQITPGGDQTTAYDQAIRAFDRLQTGLSATGASLEQVIRVWLYLGDIVGVDAGGPRYQQLNRARSDVFQACDFGNYLRLPQQRSVAYPASTGIGTAGRGLVISCLAVVPEPDTLVAVPLENPHQTSAFDYGPHYSPQSPKFSRGLALSGVDWGLVFVSGTASITESETRHAGDVASQIRQTLDNIEALIGEPNLARHGLADHGAGLDDLIAARVYLKRIGDFPLVQSLCRARLGDVPISFVEADVCRPDLLVEIEGLAYRGR